MSTFATLIKKTPIVVILDEVDPYCHKILDVVSKFKIEDDKLTLFYVDKEDNGKDILQEALASITSEDNNLPHIYLGGKLYYNGQQLEKMQSNNAFRNELAAVGAVNLPGLTKAKELIASNVLVVFLTQYSPFCEDVKAVIRTYKNLTDKKLRLIYVDERTDGTDLLEAAMFLSKTENPPVIFLGNEPFGTFSEFKQSHEKFELYDKFSNSGFIPSIPHEKLKKLKETVKILIIGNSFSPFSLKIVDIFQNLQLPTGALRVINEGNEAEQLETAAMIDTKNREGPYLYINGESVLHSVIENMSESELIEFLKTRDVL